MNSHQKFHLTSILAIMVTVFLVYSLGKKQPVEQEPVHVIGNRFIMIYEASWGLNCNDFIQQTMVNRKAVAAKHPPGEEVKYNDGQPKDLHLQERNNILLQLSNMCNTRETCDFDATTKLFGEPYKTCNKSLDISYRCFEYDRIHEIKANEGKKVHIDCTEQDEEKPADTPNS